MLSPELAIGIRRVKGVKRSAEGLATGCLVTKPKKVEDSTDAQAEHSLDLWWTLCISGRLAHSGSTVEVHAIRIANDA